jgi:hypothetical protein
MPSTGEFMEGQSLFGERVGAVSHRVLKGLAGLVWLIGGGILMIKGAELLLEAADLLDGGLWPWLGFPAGLLLGYLKAVTLFRPSCEKNLSRINHLENPRVWQFFSPRFFLSLLLMISAGAALSQIAHGHGLLLVLVGVLDLSISSALLLSFPAYLRTSRTPAS